MVHTLPSPKTTKKAKIVGRGQGSGKGAHSTGRGNNGQKSRSGYDAPGPQFEGGQMPLSRRLPKLKGFSRKMRKATRGYYRSKEEVVALKLSQIESKVKEGETLSIDRLVELNVLMPKSHKKTKVKVLFDKKIDKKLNFEGLALSAKAVDAVNKAGGSVKA